jgi:hypothetical protein
MRERDFEGCFLSFALREKGLGDEGKASVNLIDAPPSL